MPDSGFLLVEFLFFISLLGHVYTIIILYKSKRNPLIMYLSIGGSILNLAALTSFVNGHESELERAVRQHFKERPSVACFTQAMVIQFCAFVTAIAASCFAYHTYRLLVLSKRDDLSNPVLMRNYLIIVVAYPTVFTAILLGLSIRFNGIQPRAVICDINEPLWIRLFGYSGANLLCCLPGVYFSARAAYAVFKHMDQFKTGTSSASSSKHSGLLASGSHGGNSSNDASSKQEITSSDATPTTTNTTTTVQNDLERAQGTSQMQKTNTKRYNITRAAALRMVSFSSLFLLVNVLVGIQTIFSVLQGTELDPTKVGGSDFGGSIVGLFVFLVFDTGRDSKRFWKNFEWRDLFCCLGGKRKNGENEWL